MGTVFAPPDGTPSGDRSRSSSPDLNAAHVSSSEPSGARSAPPRSAPAGSAAVAERAVLNTLYRSGGEILGRLASLVLFAEAGRTLGQSGLGAFVFAVAYLGFVSVGIDIGLDRWLLRTGARDHTASDRLFFTVLSLKTTLAVPLFLVGFVVLHELGYHHHIEATVWALAPGVFFDSVARTQLATFLAHERGGPPALADTIQRIISAALGIAALKAGFGVVAVAVSYSAGSFAGVIIGFLLMAKTLGMPTVTVSARRWRRMAAQSVPFATQDTFSALLGRVDALLLAVIATQAAVGRYGAAYRMFESTLLITYALGGAFAAMFTYLGANTDPPLAAMFQRAIKLSLVLLTPIAIAFTLRAGSICRLIYGPGFVSAGVPLRILGPAVILMGLVTLTNSLMISRDNPKRMVSLTAVMAVVNVSLNAILIPLYNDAGAASAMLITEIVYAAWILRMGSREVGGIHWLATAAGATAAGGTMIAVTLALDNSLLTALALGGAAYAIVLIVTERLVSPLDVKFAADMARRRLLSRSPG